MSTSVAILISPIIGILAFRDFSPMKGSRKLSHLHVYYGDSQAISGLSRFISKEVLATLQVCRILYKYLGTLALESNERRLRRSVSALISYHTTYGRFYIRMRKNSEKMHIL